MIYRNDTGRTLRLVGVGRIDPGRELVVEKAINSPLLTEIRETKEKDKKKEENEKETINELSE